MTMAFRYFTILNTRAAFNATKTRLGIIGRETITLEILGDIISP